MSFFGNIMTIYNPEPPGIEEVKTILDQQGLPFELIESTFFFGTKTPTQSRTLRKTFSGLDIEFSFFYLDNPDGSTFTGHEIDQDQVDHIRDIFGVT